MQRARAKAKLLPSKQLWHVNVSAAGVGHLQSSAHSVHQSQCREGGWQKIWALGLKFQASNPHLPSSLDLRHSTITHPSGVHEANTPSQNMQVFWTRLPEAESGGRGKVLQALQRGSGVCTKWQQQYLPLPFPGAGEIILSSQSWHWHSPDPCPSSAPYVRWPHHTAVPPCLAMSWLLLPPQQHIQQQPQPTVKSGCKAGMFTDSNFKFCP